MFHRTSASLRSDPRCVCPGENPLEFLRSQAQFQNMRHAIQQNPALLPTLLQQLGRENPQLLQVRTSRTSRTSRTPSCYRLNL